MLLNRSLEVDVFLFNELIEKNERLKKSTLNKIM